MLSVSLYEKFHGRAQSNHFAQRHKDTIYNGACTSDAEWHFEDNYDDLPLSEAKERAFFVVRSASAGPLASMASTRTISKQTPNPTTLRPLLQETESTYGTDRRISSEGQMLTTAISSCLMSVQ